MAARRSPLAAPRRRRRRRAPGSDRARRRWAPASVTSTSTSPSVHTGASALTPSFVLSASTTRRAAASIIARLTTASGRLMLVTPPSIETPLQPRKTVSTRNDSNMVVANGSTSECCLGRSVPPVTTIVKRGWAASSSRAIVMPLVMIVSSLRSVRSTRAWANAAVVGADVDDDRLAVGDERGGGGGDRRLLVGLPRRHLLERSLTTGPLTGIAPPWTGTPAGAPRAPGGRCARSPC